MNYSRNTTNKWIIQSPNKNTSVMCTPFRTIDKEVYCSLHLRLNFDWILLPGGDEKTERRSRVESVPMLCFLASPIPEPRGLLEHHTWLHNQFPSLCSVIHCPLGVWRTQSLCIPWCYLSASHSDCTVFFPFYCALRNGLGQTSWTGGMPSALLHSSKPVN